MLAKLNGKTNFSQIEWLTTEAVAKHKEGKPEEAIAIYLEIIELETQQPSWLYGNAITLMTQTKWLNESLELAQKALKIHPESDEIYRALGLAANKQGDFKNTISY
jgi:tetratricopeptide (TPR) repeat protein